MYFHFLRYVRWLKMKCSKWSAPVKERVSIIYVLLVFKYYICASGIFFNYVMTWFKWGIVSFKYMVVISLSICIVYFPIILRSLLFLFVDVARKDFFLLNYRLRCSNFCGRLIQNTNSKSLCFDFIKWWVFKVVMMSLFL